MLRWQCCAGSAGEQPGKGIRGAVEPVLLQDASLFFKHIDSKLTGMTGSYVDDSLLCGDKRFLRLSDKSLEKFESRERKLDSTTFAGVRTKTTPNGFGLSQEQ